MDQAQQQIQQQGQGNFPILNEQFNIDNLPNPDQNNTNSNLQNSYINSQLSYTLASSHLPTLTDNCIPERKDITASCLLGFLGCCDNLKLLMGPYCNAHQSLLFNRRFLATTNDGTSPMTSGGNCTMECHSTMFLTSTLPGRITEDDISFSLSPLTRGLDAHNHSNILKFYTLLASPENTWNMDSYMNGFKKYIVDISSDYFQYVAQYRPIIERSIVPVVVSPRFFERIQTSLFWRTVFDKVEKQEIQAIIHSNNSNNNSPMVANRSHKITYNIPLSMFNILDILTILSFNFDIRTGCVGYLPNTMIYDGVFVIGTATGIHNTLKTINNKPNFCAYPPNVAKLLSEVFHIPNHNLDYIILNIVPSVEIQDAVHVIAVAERRNIVPKDMYLEKITRKIEPSLSLAN